jgi:integrase
MGNLTQKGLDALLKKPPKRWPDGDGLFFKTARDRKAYFTFRFTLAGKETETSIGPHPEMSLDAARIRHLELRALVLKGIDPVAKRQAKTAPAPSGAPTFGSVSDAYLDRQEKRGELGKNPKHRQQWRNTLASLPASFRALRVDEIGPQQVFDALDPIWALKPETASRLRGRIAMVLDFARKPEDTHPNPAAWAGWLKTQLGSAKKLGKIDRKTGERVKRGHHASMPYQEVPAFMARLREIDSDPSRALQTTILTTLRTDELLGLPFDEIDLERAVLNIDGKRMKMGEPHRVPLSDAALAILKAQKAQYETRGKNPYVFPGRPMKPLSNMSMAMLLRRMKCKVTVHGFRSSFRNWATEVDKTEYATAERCLAHVFGNDSSLSYDRSDRLDLRRPVMERWADYVCAASNVVPFRAATSE